MRFNLWKELYDFVEHRRKQEKKIRKTIQTAERVLLPLCDGFNIKPPTVDADGCSFYITRRGGSPDDATVQVSLHLNGTWFIYSPIFGVLGDNSDTSDDGLREDIRAALGSLADPSQRSS